MTKNQTERRAEIIDRLTERMSERQQERQTQLREITVSEPSERDAPYSAGVVVTFHVSRTNSIALDMNRAEATALRDALNAFLED